MDLLLGVMKKEDKVYIISDITELPDLAAEILSDITHNITLLVGDLGAGKTTLVKQLIQLLGSEDTGSSPSFSIINKYALTSEKDIFHIDLYRVESAEEAFNLGIEEILYADNHCFIEWPQIIYDYIQSPYHIIKIEVDENNNRKITLSSE